MGKSAPRPMGKSAPRPAAQTPEQAREAGRKGGLASAAARKRKRLEAAALSADERARRKFNSKADQLAQVLIDAALGQGAFVELEPKDRVGYAVKALEYGIGRPRPMAEKPPEEEASQDGLHFTIGPGPEPPVETEEPGVG